MEEGVDARHILGVVGVWLGKHLLRVDVVMWCGEPVLDINATNVGLDEEANLCLGLVMVLKDGSVMLKVAVKVTVDLLDGTVFVFDSDC